MYLKATIIIALLCGTVAPAFSQVLDDTGRPRRPGDDGLARVQSSITIGIPVKDDEDIAVQQQAGLRSFYKVAASSCAMVIETIADTCEVTSVTTNVNARDRNMGGIGGSQITVVPRQHLCPRFEVVN
ncbi:hypothetical protein LGH82_00030 [Mesorhizobium sp. PAMC28654]|uniref:hypothetical protein n=1 Tax=Mesorhizobium sp. PAMC28654 TaxID=2880934 RepID=UPI001D0BB97A|nr:hypothetical protein [Mesorhizobium sp. PAMC28654]UDL89844.1 hypothetical protein LGH82_00030 [Mesorhizobium sp. PAMC28654]